MRLRSLLLTMSVVCLATVASAQQRGWSAATDLYLAGQYEQALDVIASLPPIQIRDGAREALAGLSDRQHAQALLGLWTEVYVDMERGLQDDPRKVRDPSWPIVCCRWSSIVLTPSESPMNGKRILANPKGTLVQIVQDGRGATTEFLTAWYALVLSHLNAGSYYLRDDCLTFAPGAVQKSPDWLMAVARHQENDWYFVRESNWPLRITVDLGRAKSALQKVLESDPKQDEAILRLGHITSLMGDEADALKILGTVVAPMDPKFVYLARMFEAEILEKKGDLASTQEAYERALAAYPGQSARVALARVSVLRGQPHEWVSQNGGSPPRDPWAEYYYGFEGQLEKYRERLRAAVRGN